MIKRFLKRFGIWGHWCNDNHKPGDRKGSIVRYGRLFLHLGDWGVMHWCWNLWTRFCGFEIRVDSEDGICFHISFPPISFWYSIHIKPINKWCFKHDWLDIISIRIFDWGIWIHLWADDSGTDYRQPWWVRRKWNWHPIDTIFGRWKYKETELDIVEALIPMPEKSYKAKIKMILSEWKRPRLLWTRRMVRSDVDMIEPIPFPGKGENSWDCGEDSLHGQTSCSKTVEEAIAGIVKSVLTSRRKYGGRNWQPKEKCV